MKRQLLPTKKSVYFSFFAISAKEFCRWGEFWMLKNYYPSACFPSCAVITIF